MRTRFINFEVHLYSENRLQDDQIERRKKGYGLYSTEFYNNLFSYMNRKISFELPDGITIGEIKSIIFNLIFGTDTETVESFVDLYFITPDYRYSIDNPDKDFVNVLDKYLDPEFKGEITVGLYVCEDAGHFDRAGRLQYDFRSHEDGPHHEPHVHVYVIGKDYEEPVSILTGEPLNKNPKMPQKYLTQAKEYILDEKNNSRFRMGWNTRSDGLKIDINNALGLSEI